MITNLQKERTDEVIPVYNFCVSDWSSYFVSEWNVYVHNAKYNRESGSVNGRTDVFKLPDTVKSGKGVEGKFSVPGYQYRIDINKVAPGEGGFHLHIYRKNKEIAKVTERGGYVETHKGKTLLSLSQMDKTVKKEINKLVKHAQKSLNRGG